MSMDVGENSGVRLHKFHHSIQEENDKNLVIDKSNGCRKGGK
jgi:hypothetical protein